MFNTPDDWGNYFRRCGDCGQQYHASEGGCDCGGPEVYCTECGEFICREAEEGWESRDSGRLCTRCADKFDHTCADCGEVYDGDLVQDGESSDGAPWMVCPRCKEKANAGA